MITVYLAGPLFTLAEQEFNKRLAELLHQRDKNLCVVLPQERAKPLLQKENGIELVFRDCLEMLDSSDVVVGILDGSDADSGTCIELGYAFSHNKPIVGVRTDSRASEDRGLNLMVSHICSSFVQSHAESTSVLAEELAVAILGAIQNTHQAK